MGDTLPLRLLSLGELIDSRTYWWIEYLIVFAIDGGGIRGLSSLYILRSIMLALENNVEEVDAARHQLLPCEYFDLIAGTSTGGLATVMLGTLRMDVDTCIKEYLNMAPDIFPVEGVVSGSRLGRVMGVVRGRQRFDPASLEEAVKRLVGEHLADRAIGGEDTPIQFEASRDNKNPQCKVYGLLCMATELG
ncbi:hypothetical protein FGG08_003574 [Glutinoglossum americanum]|uniref:PNPLA domain-containing protein n=1 Tax=Glutinoglossum americanum TaxID=1670608 RepID=A0A9P8I2B6_9PEZI|nr:hypothetical protein FGG08_003574 [Glutinoglossum americanum]